MLAARRTTTMLGRTLADVDRIKWLLWHGNQRRALETIGFFEVDVWRWATQTSANSLAPHMKFAVYIASNTGSLINFGERCRAGERISSCLAESTVNAVISKRFAKRRVRAASGEIEALVERNPLTVVECCTACCAGRVADRTCSAS
jgi:hypothetical protein